MQPSKHPAFVMECDINAATGVITDWDVDSIYD